MGELAAFVKKNPEMLAFAVIAVVLLAWLQSRNSSASADSGGVTFTGGGVAAAPVDPGVVSMEEARISAGTANLTTLSQLFLGLNEAAYQRDVSEGQTSAALSASLAQTEAQRTVGLAQIESNVRINADQVAGHIQEAIYNTSAATAQATINANTQAQITQANLTAHLEDLATQRDVARVQSKSHFWSDLFGGAEKVVAAIFGG